MVKVEKLPISLRKHLLDYKMRLFGLFFNTVQFFCCHASKTQKNFSNKVCPLVIMMPVQPISSVQYAASFLCSSGMFSMKGNNYSQF